ncbi:MAG: 4-hydroxy-tetrahydrodipicolinate reductase [Clostridium sp.]
MVRVLLNGCSGKMGKTIVECSNEFPSIEIVGGIDKFESHAKFPIFKDCASVNIEYDVLLDFSRADALNDILDLTEKTNKPLVICSTGYSPEQVELINEKSKSLKLFRSGNMTLGINLIASLLKKVAPILFGNYDIEIVEKHHNQKVDSPSGTALLLGDAIREVIPSETHYVHGRDGNAKREKNEIGVHAVRGGSIVGDHDVIFAGTGEVIEISHKAISRDVFAIGALKACEYMGKVTECGLYDMSDVIGL